LDSGNTKAPATPLLTANKKFKAPLSVENRKIYTKPKSASTLAPIPSTPTKKGDGSSSRPRTPISPRPGSASPRKGAESPFLFPATSEMDVSNVDPESVLVDFENVEPGDVSGEIDEAWLKTSLRDHGSEDKVMVSVRYSLRLYISAMHSNILDIEFVPPIRRLPGFQTPMRPGSSSTLPSLGGPPHPLVPHSTSTPSSPEPPTNPYTPPLADRTSTPPWRATTQSSSRTDKLRLGRRSR
jgi:hypothetical protein